MELTVDCCRARLALVAIGQSRHCAEMEMQLASAKVCLGYVPVMRANCRSQCRTCTSMERTSRGCHDACPTRKRNLNGLDHLHALQHRPWWALTPWARAHCTAGLGLPIAIKPAAGLGKTSALEALNRTPADSCLVAWGCDGLPLLLPCPSNRPLQ